MKDLPHFDKKNLPKGSRKFEGNGTFPCKLAEGSGYYHEMVEVIMSKGNGIYYEW